MPKRLSYEEVKKEFEKRGFELLDKDYINNNVKMSFKNKEGYIAQMKLANLKSGKNPCYFSKTNYYVLYNIQRFINIQESKTILIDGQTFVGNFAKLKFICGTCNNIFERTWGDLQQSKQCECAECSKIVRGKKRRLSIEKVRKCFTEHGLTLLSEEYVGNNKYLECEDNLGYRGFATYANITQKGDSFSRFDRRVNEKYFFYNVQHYANLNSLSCKVLGFAEHQRWSGKNIGIKFQCACGNIFETSLNSFRNGKWRCEECAKSISRYEYNVMTWLKQNKIKFVRQKIFEDCKDVIALRFDFYIPHKNLLIEVDGQGHYFPAHFNQISKENAVKSFTQIQKHDKIKDEYCKKNNIQLLRIPYWDMKNNNYKTILEQALLK